MNVNASLSAACLFRVTVEKLRRIPLALAPAFLALVIALNFFIAACRAQGTAFTYQGQLQNNGSPANGLYDFRFRLFLDQFGNTQAGATILSNAIPVANGLFITTLNFGPGIFTGSNYWLEVDVKTNNAGTYSDLSPLQPVTPTPYAIFAATASNVSGTITSGSVSGNYGNAVTFNNSANSFTGTFAGNGLNVSNVNAVALNGLTATNFWQTTGNSHTSAGPNYVGTADNQPLELRVNNQRAMRYEPDASPNISPNVIGGSVANRVDNNSFGVVIGGGGFPNGSNVVSADFSTIAGGAGNIVSNSPGSGFNILSDFSSIGGGDQNSASGASVVAGGYKNQANPPNGFAVVGGGYENSASSDSAFVGGGGYDGENFLEGGNAASGPASAVVGGLGNIASGIGSFVGGGGDGLQGSPEGNTASGMESVVVGGLGNRASGLDAFIGDGYLNVGGGNGGFIGGGQQNTNSHTFSSVVGGEANTAGGYDSAVVGGIGNMALGRGAFVGGGGDDDGTNVSGNTASGDSSFVGGGLDNTASGIGSFIGGGGNVLNVQVLGNTAMGTCSVIGGGAGNIAGDSGSFVGGGFSNTNNGLDSIICGGVGNFISGGSAETVIGGGQNNVAESGGAIVGGFNNIANNTGAFIGAGGYGASSVLGNLASGFNSVVTGGAANSASGFCATVPGGISNICSGAYAFAAGSQALATNNGSFVWADPQNGPFASTATNQFLVRAHGGVGINWNSNPDASENASLFVQGNNSNNWQNSVVWLQNTNSSTNIAPALRIVNNGHGTNFDGALSVSVVGSGLIAEFGNSGTFVVQITNNGTIYATAFSTTSDRNAKQDFATINPQDVLAKVAAMPITQWSFKIDSGTRHMGPMAQDFYKAFSLGSDDRHITTVDEDGVALAAIQGLNQKLEEKDRQITALENRLDKLEQLLNAQEKPRQ